MRTVLDLALYPFNVLGAFAGVASFYFSGWANANSTNSGSALANVAVMLLILYCSFTLTFSALRIAYSRRKSSGLDVEYSEGLVMQVAVVSFLTLAPMLALWAATQYGDRLYESDHVIENIVFSGFGGVVGMTFASFCLHRLLNPLPIDRVSSAVMDVILRGIIDQHGDHWKQWFKQANPQLWHGGMYSVAVMLKCMGIPYEQMNGITQPDVWTLGCGFNLHRRYSS